MPNCDSKQFQPPAPVAFVTLRKPNTRIQLSDVPMLLDTGADVTLVPRSALASLEITLSSERSFELMGFDGTRSAASAVELDLVFGQRVFQAQFLLIDQPIGILGRNILNKARLVFDSPNLNWEEQPS